MRRQELLPGADCARATCARCTKARPGVRAARYRLVRDTGPRAPRERRVRALWDDNERRYAHVPGTAR